MVAAPSRTSWARVCSVLSGILVAASPFVLYFAIRRGRVEEAGLLLFGYAILRAVPAVLAAKPEHRRAALRLPLVAVVTASVGLLAHEPRVLLALPSASQLAFGGLFLGSLRGTPLVEHFARMKSPDLSPAKVIYCRRVTVLWGVTLAVAAAVGIGLAAWGRLDVWMAFTGVGSYVLVGALFSGEWITRKIRFREYDDNVLDRIFRRLFPPPAVVHAIDLGAGDAAAARVELPRGLVFFRGHFDGMPILPGIVQLTEIVLPLARRRHPGLGPLRSLRRVRFRRPILPGETIDAEVHGEPPNDLRFELKVRGDVVASGAMGFGDA